MYMWIPHVWGWVTEVFKFLSAYLFKDRLICCRGWRRRAPWDCSVHPVEKKFFLWQKESCVTCFRCWNWYQSVLVSHLNSLFRRVVSCYWWVWTLRHPEENQMCFCSEAVFLPVWRTSAVGAWQRRLPAARPKSWVTERLKSRSAAHLWRWLNWWVRSGYPTVSNVSMWSKQVGVKQ